MGEHHSPTMRFRWWEPRDPFRIKTYYYECGDSLPVRVLQQWWEPHMPKDERGEGLDGEWRDVPIEVER